MSLAYDEYLAEHISNVNKGLQWMLDNLGLSQEEKSAIEDAMTHEHDASKYSREEYEAYDYYFYGGNKSYAVVQSFNYAWLHHIHNNPHHWQYWVLLEDDPEEGLPYKTLMIPLPYIFEMIADWWTFSWKNNNLFEIFNWYWEHREKQYIHPESRKILERILEKIWDVLIMQEAVAGHDIYEVENQYRRFWIEQKTEQLSLEHSDDHLEHHGILGQKWGVRRYQNPDGSRTAEGKQKEAQNRRINNALSTVDDVNKIVATLPEEEQLMLGVGRNDKKWIPDDRRNQIASEIAKTFIEYDGDKPVSMLEIWDIGDGKADISLATNPKYRGTGVTSKNIKAAVDWFNSGNNKQFDQLQWNNLKMNPKSGQIAEHYGFGDYDEDDKWEYRRIFKNEPIEHSGIKGQKWGQRNGPPYPLDSAKVAEKIFNDAKAKSKKITSDVESAAKRSGGEMHGLENQLKTADSIERKLNKKMSEKDMDITEAANSIKDAVRYTVIAPTNKFVDMYYDFKADMSRKGYEETSCDNYFDKFNKGEVKHKAVQSNFADKDGYEFEVQFHTPESQNAKDKKLPLYNERRETDISEARAKELEKQMEALAKNVPDPKGVEDILSHEDREDSDEGLFGIPELKKYPMPNRKHVKSAIRFFNYVDPKYEKELAESILEKADEFGIDLNEDITVGDDNRFKKYLKKEES